MHSVEGAVSLVKHLSYRTISTSFVCFTNHYEILGLKRSATFADIKAAYYKKSKECHPDLNVDDEEAAQRFRAITEAYEVLGNVHSKKLYDKGAVFKDRQFETTENKFHQSRGKIVPSEGNFKIYDFDECDDLGFVTSCMCKTCTSIDKKGHQLFTGRNIKMTQAHYSKTFVDGQKIRKSERKLNSFHIFSSKTSYELYALGVASVFFFGSFIFFSEKKINEDRLERKKIMAEKLKNDKV